MQSVPSPRGPPKNVVLFGSGLQSQTHAEVFLKIFPTIKNVTFVGRSESSRLKACVRAVQIQFAKDGVKVTSGIAGPPSEESQKPSGPKDTPGSEMDEFEIVEAQEPETYPVPFNLSQAIHNADIIITCTSSTVPLFNHVDVTSQSHIIMIGSYTPEMHEVEVDLIKRAGVVVVDTARGCAKEAGELIDAGLTDSEGGGMVELGELLGQEESAKPLLEKVQSEGDVFLYKSVGIGIQDVSIAKLVLDKARDLGLGLIVKDYD
jgi:ornithine cyclodeaminase/alanine dehydrogenase-like protein (mu-crystallin family)